ncbi:amidase [Bisporella sp. PMI_857]|nr:amidase [Bisporella sp. PMI_857]
MPARTWQELAAAKQEEQLSRIPKEWLLAEERLPPANTVDLRPVAASSGILSTRELEITGEDYDATSLLAKIADGTYSSKEAATAFRKRAAIGQQLCKNLMEIMFLDAIAAAGKLDEEFAQTGKPVGPLHGLPMTVKILKKAGAAFIAKTNNPQTMLAAETDNNVFGQTNPVVSHLTCGGSSGGEGSAQVFRSSALGIGTDVGGSIRIPAAANGTYGFKPSFGILPMIGYAPANYTGMQTGVPAVCGPLARPVRDIILLMCVVREAKPWLVDPAIIPNVWEAATLNRKPVVGIMYKSGLTPHPPVLRALSEAREKLEAVGFEVKDFVPPGFAELRLITRQLFTLDGLLYRKKEIEKSGEPVVPSVKEINFWDIPAKTLVQMWEWNTKKLEIVKQMLDKRQEAKIDVLLCPGGPHMPWNANDYPAAIIPFTFVDPTKDFKDDNFVPLSEDDRELRALFDLELLVGAPVAL